MMNALHEANAAFIKETFSNPAHAVLVSATTNETVAGGEVSHTVRPMAGLPIASLEAADLADEFLRAEFFQTNEGLGLRCSGKHGHEWLAFNGRSYAVLPGHVLRNRIVSFLRRCGARSRASRGLVDTIEMHLSAICAIPHTVTLPARFNGNVWVPAPDSIILSNGVLDLGALIRRDHEPALTAHTPNFIGTVQLPYAYNLGATCRRWHEFLDTIFPGDPQSKQFLKEIFGYCLTYDISQEKFFIFEGSGANGKSTCLKVLAKLLGEANVSAVPLERFGEKHDLINTLGKLVNIVTEVGYMKSFAEGILKAFVSGDYMSFDPKHQPAFTAKATAKVVIGTNHLPPITDKSDGVWRRASLLPFPVTISPEKRNPHLDRDLFEELDGIFVWAVRGLLELRKRGHFEEPESSRIALEAYRNDSSPARIFLSETCVKDENARTDRSELYRDYKTWASEYNYVALGEMKFYKEVREYFGCQKEIRPRGEGGGQRPRYYQGFRYDRNSKP